jgi:hypothetical protein
MVRYLMHSRRQFGTAASDATMFFPKTSVFPKR